MFDAAVRYSGKNKQQLEDLVKEHDRNFVQKRYRCLNSLDSEFVQSASRITILEPSEQIITSICNNSFNITRSIVRQIISGALSIDVIKICLHLFRQREERINIAYLESNRG